MLCCQHLCVSHVVLVHAMNKFPVIFTSMWSELFKVSWATSVSNFFSTCYCRKSVLSSLRELGTKILQPYRLQVKDQILKAKIIIDLLSTNYHWFAKQKLSLDLLSTRFFTPFNQIWWSQTNKVLCVCHWIMKLCGGLENLTGMIKLHHPPLSSNCIQSF